MVNCCAFGCSNRSEKRIEGMSFHQLPTDPELKAAWIMAIQRDNWNPSQRTYLCSEHFIPEDINRTYASGRAKLREGSIPCIFPEVPKNNRKSKKKRKVPIVKREIVEVRPGCSIQEVHEPQPCLVSIHPVKKFVAAPKSPRKKIKVEKIEKIKLLKIKIDLDQ